MKSQVFILNRIGKKKKRSGGITILVKDNICKYVEILNGSSNDVLWFRVEKTIFDKNILFGAVYIAPEGSIFCSLDCFDLIADDLAKFANDSPELAFCLLGDFNARTANLPDILLPDENLCNNLGLDNGIFDVYNNVGGHESLLEQDNLFWKRNRAI